MNGDKSKRIFHNITEIIKNQGQDVEASKGIIWRSITSAHAHFIEDLGVSKVYYEFDLFPDMIRYPLPSWVMKIEGYSARRGDDFSNEEGPEFNFTLPAISTSDKRFILIDDFNNEIAAGDVLILECEIAVPDDYEIDEEHDPIIDKRYYRLLEDYVIAGYETGVSKQRGGRTVMLSEIKQQQVDAKVLRKMEQSYSLNRIGTTLFNQVRFGNYG